MLYALYYPEEGRYSELMPLIKARAMKKHFITAVLIDARTGEVIF